jgi:uncharacterized protein
LASREDVSSIHSHQQSLLLPVELFEIPDSYYVFDANHVIFLEINDVVFKIISTLSHETKNFNELVEDLPEHSSQEIRKALDEIEGIQKNQGFLKMHDFKRDKPYTISDIKKNLTSNLNGLYLNITSKCNLSCFYCIFGGDYTDQYALQQKEMTWDTAQKAIEFFFSRARKEGRLRVDFFGGEPLLSFPLMERIVKSIKERIFHRNQELIISVSSNGTVMNDKILDFLIKHDVLFQVSIDGEKEIQDAKRKFKRNNIGSFDTILQNLQLIFDRNPDYYYNRVSLKAVLTTESLEAGDKGFLKIPLIATLNNKKRFSMLNQRPHFDLKKDTDFFSRIHKLAEILLKKQGSHSIEELIDGLDYKKKYLFYHTFYEFFQVQVVNSLYFDIEQPVPFSKDCMIGIEGCVNVDGSISICYKSSNFIIGNVVENTWYFDRIEEFNNKRYSLTECKSCFIKRFCKLCYEKLDGEKGQFSSSLQKFCDYNRHYYRVIFEYMLKILEKNPDLWGEMQKIAEKNKEYLEKKRSGNVNNFEKKDMGTGK